MNKKAFNFITENYEVEQTIPEYSGRYMYGEKTNAIVVGDREEFYDVLACAIEDCNDQDTLYELTDLLRNHKIDNMGKSIVVY